MWSKMPTLPQELIDHIVDVVHAEVSFRTRRPYWADILALLRAARCFGARCRKHLFGTVCIELEITPPSDIDKTLDVASLRFLELVRHTPPLADLVKHVYYGLYFELRDVSHISSTTAWHMLRKLAPYLTRLELVTLYCYDSRESTEGFCMSLDSQIVRAIGQIIPSSPFPKLSLEKMELLPVHLVDLLTYCPHIISLEINEVSLAYDYTGDNNAVRPAVPSKIEELVVAEADSFLFEVVGHNACRTLFASTRRLVFAGFTSWSDDLGAPLGEFIPRLRTLEKVFFRLSSHLDIDFDVRALLHAPSLCLEMSDSSNSMPALSRALMQSPSYPSKLRRVTIIVHRFRGDSSIVEWRELASALDQPRFAALEALCITFSSNFSD
ncbi:hypothetical protein BDZ89DRAFT_205140 [Hymenopellis radicata]|nr:hypothetical protein BDZ89DRAFT_205140 [Hymenopellis radicata]